MSKPLTRLYSVGSEDTGGENTSGTPYVYIDLPHMPEVLSLARTANFAATPVQMFPDGVMHVYQSTSIMEVPIDFKLHAFDDYCTEGAVTLLSVAARLHAMQLPILTAAGTKNLNSTPSASTFVTTPPPKEAPEGTQGTLDSTGATSTSIAAGSSVAAAQAGDYFFPTPCVLDLIDNGRGMGVKLVGYLKSVKTDLKGPWMQAQDGGRNLPSSAAYSFTFVNAPGYQNDISVAMQQVSQFYAADVARSLYRKTGKAGLPSRTGIFDSHIPKPKVITVSNVRVTGGLMDRGIIPAPQTPPPLNAPGLPGL